MSASTRVTGARKHLAGALGVVFILALWQAAALALPDFLMPGVPAVLTRLVEDLGNPSTRACWVRWAVLAPAMAWRWRPASASAWWRRCCSSSARCCAAPSSSLQSIPSIAWVPLFLIVMGFGSAPIIVVVALSAFFPAALSVMNATESVQRVHVSAARVMGATRWGWSSGSTFRRSCPNSSPARSWHLAMRGGR